MKVAIMGAGLAGLACAITLERNGIIPDVFEKKSRVGDTFVHIQAIPTIIDHPISDPIKHLAEEYQIYIKPNSNISDYYVFGENEMAHISGRIGFLNLRGRHPNSLENQLYEQLNHTSVHFNSTYTYEQLLHNYTHVILATGDAGDAIKLRNFQRAISINMKGATIKGSFNSQKVFMWLNDNFAPNGYSLLLPFSETEANIVIGYPDTLETATMKEQLWTKFTNHIAKFLKHDLEVVDSFSIKNYIMGQSLNPRLGNTFFVGNCVGAIMPFMGIGQTESIMTGIYAAQDIIGIGDYKALVKPMIKSNKESLILRKGMNKMNNAGYDRLIKVLNTQFAQAMLRNDHLNIIKIVSTIINPLI